MIVPTEPRCGDCTVCCHIAGFTGDYSFTDKYNEAEKFGLQFDPMQTCNKLCDTGCSIQENKPRICSEFFCEYVKQDLDDQYYPKDCGFMATVNVHDENYPDAWPYPDTITILSMDKTLPPEIQYNNNKQLLDNLIEEIEISIGRKLPVELETNQGWIYLRR